MAGKLGHMSGLRQAFWILSFMVYQNTCISLNSHGTESCSAVREIGLKQDSEYTQVVGSNTYITNNYFMSKKALKAVCTLRE